MPSLNDPLVQSMLNNPQLMNSILQSLGGGGGGLNSAGLNPLPSATSTTNTMPAFNPFLFGMPSAPLGNPTTMPMNYNNATASLFGASSPLASSGSVSRASMPVPSSPTTTNATTASSNATASLLATESHADQGAAQSSPEDRYRIQIAQMNEMGFSGMRSRIVLVFVFVCLFVCVFVCLVFVSVCLFVCLLACKFVCLLVCLFGFCFCLFVCLRVWLRVCLFG
jgi:hypothetical protein